MSARGEALVHLPYPLPKKKKKLIYLGRVFVCVGASRGASRELQDVPTLRGKGVSLVVLRAFCASMDF